MDKPNWFKKGKVLVVNAQTCGINKDGHEQYIINPKTGLRTGDIDDDLAVCCEKIIQGDFDREEIFYQNYEELVEKDIYVPQYYDKKTLKEIESRFQDNSDFTLMSLGEMVSQGLVTIFGGHGSPSSDQRLGTVPYIKVSDLRAGHVNINPTNMIPLELAKEFWAKKSKDKNNVSSGLMPYDLISPERASKNIGEFCVLMPDQEASVFTKEVIIIRSTALDRFDQFYLMWALSLKEVRKQWKRIVFMQTNREDVGKRMLEIKIPVPENITIANKYSKSFKDYYIGLEKNRSRFIKELKKSDFEHHIYLKS